MINSLKLILLIMLLIINTSFIGCGRYKTPTASQRSMTKQYSSRTQEASGEKEANKKENAKKKISKKALLDVPIIPQNPELKNGCEVTSLAMLLQYAGLDVDKMTLAEKIKKDETPLVHDENGNIKEWGDPNMGFVGDITGKNAGFGVYPKPMLELLEQYMPGKSVDLTGQPFEALLQSIDEGKPVIAWVTIDFTAPEDYKEWEKDGNKIKATLDEHAVLMVGYNKKYCYINNPYSEEKNQKIKKATFIEIWDTMENMAISYQ